MTDQKLNILTITEYNLIATKDPVGSYDRRTRENLYAIIYKLSEARANLSPLEFTVFQKFQRAQFAPLGEKDKKVKFEVLRYLLSDRVRRTARMTGIILVTAVVSTPGASYSNQMRPSGARMIVASRVVALRVAR